MFGVRTGYLPKNHSKSIECGQHRFSRGNKGNQRENSDNNAFCCRCGASAYWISRREKRVTAFGNHYWLVGMGVGQLVWVVVGAELGRYRVAHNYFRTM